MNANCCPPDTARPTDARQIAPTPGTDAMRFLVERIDRLSGAVELLEGRLEPLLGMPSNKPDTNAAGPDPDRSYVTNSLLRDALLVDALGTRLFLLIDRLEF
jgi:hypothetical protein